MWGEPFLEKKVPPTPPSKKLQLGWAKSTEPEDRLMPISPTRVEDFGEGVRAILLPKRWLVLTRIHVFRAQFKK